MHTYSGNFAKVYRFGGLGKDHQIKSSLIYTWGNTILGASIVEKTTKEVYRRLGFNCKYLLIANC